MRSRTCLALLLAGVCFSTAFSQTDLKWKFQEGDKFYFLERMESKQNMTIMDQKVDQTSTMITITSFAVGKADSDGMTNVTMKIEKVHGEGANSDPEMNRRMEGSTFEIKLNKKLLITRFDGYEEFVKKLSGGDEDVARVFRQIMTEDTFKKTLETMLGCTPPQPVNAGDKWTHVVNIALGPIGKVSVTREYTYDGEAVADGKKVQRLNIGGEGTFSPPDADAKGGLPFKITKADLKFSNIKGRLDFDNQAGRVHSSQFSMDGSGSMTIEIGTLEQKVDLIQHQDLSVTVHDKMPELPKD